MTASLQTEAELERYLLEKVKKLGGSCEKVTVLGQRGFFDRLIVLPGGRVIFCELKHPKTGGRLSPHQILRVDRYTRLGAACCIIRNSADIDRLLSS